MAKDATIKNGLKLFCSNFNKSETWLESVLPLWITTLKPYKDQIAYQSIIEICQEQHKYTPKLGDVVAKIQAKIKQNKINTYNDRKFCDDCRYHSGIRITIAQYYRRDQNNRPVVSERVCSCTCDDSKETHKSLMTFEQREQKLKEDPRVELFGYLVTSRARTVFTWEERDPISYARHQEWIAEQEANGKRITTFTKHMEK